MGNVEILQVAEAVAREKGLQKETVIEALEQAIQSAGRKKYGHENEIRAEIDRKSGAIQLFRERTVVETVENAGAEITVADAKHSKEDAALGDVIREPLPPIEFGRVVSQAAKQVIMQKVRDAERDKQFDDFKDRIGEIVNGVVKRIEYGNLIVDFGKTETMLRREDLIPREIFRPGDRIRAYIVDVRRENKGPQIFLSRTHPDFLAELFRQEVPEIYDGVITIKGVARDPGSRAKIAIYSSDSSIDPVGACVGMRGSRVQAVVNELQGERIDIVQWSPDVATFLVNALSPAEASKIVIDEDNERIEVVVPDDQLSLAIGRRGQNVRLASQLVGWNIDVMTEDEESKRRLEEFNRLTALFVDALNVEEVIAHLLVTEGFKTVDEVAYVPIEDLASIEGFDEDVATELRERALAYMEEKRATIEKRLKELDVASDVLTLPGMTVELMLPLAEKGFKTRDDLGDLSRDEFKEIIPSSGKRDDEIDEMIMAARAHWFSEEENTDDKKEEKAAQG
ncbi:MAG: transcription termination/antitermination protein NusA [Hyphomicrobiales bacterium]|nr:transcription termination/antitermination protein NusA [Hyphomicrobiales bacterium]